MKARTRIQKRVVAVDEMYHPLKDEHIEWAREELFPHKAIVLKKGTITCLDCGHEWENTFKSVSAPQIAGETCPNCKRKLEVIYTKKRKFHEEKMFEILGRIREFQTHVYVKFDKRYRKGEPVKENVAIMGIIYWNPKKAGVKGHRPQWMGHRYSHGWWGERWTGYYELQNQKSINAFCPHVDAVYKKRKIHKFIKKRGFICGFHGFKSYRLFYELCTNPAIEHLYKMKMFDVASVAMDDSRGFDRIRKYWRQLVLFKRHGGNFINSDHIRTWLDYLEYLEEFGKDLMSPKYIVPDDIDRAHQRYVDKKHELERKKKHLDNQHKIQGQQKKYYRKIRAYKKLRLVDGDIEVKVIPTVKQVAEESWHFRHCAFTHNYHMDNGKLLLTASYKGTPIETVEYSLNTYKVLQSRGHYNKASAHHSKVVKLVNSSAEIFKKVEADYLKALKKKREKSKTTKNEKVVAETP